jgi:hypothetical protein
MSIKLLMTWDIAPSQEQEYFEFVVREFMPGVQRLGFELSDAWATVYGEQPQILVGAILPSLQKAESVMDSEEWGTLQNKLQDYVTNYEQKVVRVRGGFQF